MFRSENLCSLLFEYLSFVGTKDKMRIVVSTFGLAMPYE